MTENTIRELLDGVAQTGELPSDAEIRASVTKYRSVGEKTEVARRVRIAAKKIVNALDAGLPDQAVEHAADVAESLSAHTAAGAAESTDAPWERQAAREHAPATPSRSKASEPLRELLRHATQSGLRAADLDALSLKSGLSAEQRTQWRAAVVGEANQIHRLFAAGHQGEARRMADEAAARLGADLTEPAHEDPLADETDPRALADAVRQRH